MKQMMPFDEEEREFGKKKPKLPNEYEELTEYDRYVRVASVSEASGIPKLQKKFRIILIVAMCVIFIGMLMLHFLCDLDAGIVFVIIFVVEIDMAFTFVPIYFMKRTALADLLDVNRRKIILKEDKFIYSNVQTVRRYGKYNKGTYYYMYEYTIPYDNVVKIIHDTKNFKYRIECSEYSVHSIELKNDEKRKGFIDIVDIFEDPTVFQKIAIKSLDNTIIGGSIVEEKLPAIKNKELLILECVCSAIWIFVNFVMTVLVIVFD